MNEELPDGIVEMPEEKDILASEAFVELSASAAEANDELQTAATRLKDLIAAIGPMPDVGPRYIVKRPFGENRKKRRREASKEGKRGAGYTRSSSAKRREARKQKRRRSK